MTALSEDGPAPRVPDVAAATDAAGPMGSRAVTLLLCDSSGRYLGMLPELVVGTRWWPDTQPVVTEVRRRFGAEVTVLRVLDTQRPSADMGGPVTYLAELTGPMPNAVQPARTSVPGGDNLTDRVAAALADDQPCRAWWARVGGVAEAVAWADEHLAAAGRPRNGPGLQVKSWNLSLVLMLPTSQGPVWLKATPPFLGHEGAIIELVARKEPDLVPRLIARDPTRNIVLMEEVPGEDQWQATEPVLVEMVTRLVGLQVAWAHRVDELLALGLPDRRMALFTLQLRDVLARPEVRAALTASELDRLEVVAAGLPELLERVQACGIPETLLRGDFHPGNWRYDGRSLVLLDWGDSEVGHPMLDASGFLSRIADAGVRSRVRAAWVQAWRQACPGSDPSLAMDLVEPLGALRGAVIYQRFLDGIEHDERRYHEEDVPACLRHAVGPQR